MRWYVAGTVAVCLALSACSSAEQDEAAEAADRFVAAVIEDDGAAACELLAPATLAELVQSSGKSCEEAVLEEAKEAGERLETETFGTMSEVRFTDDVLFMTRFPDGWKVHAAACTPRQGRPYDCTIKGG